MHIKKAIEVLQHNWMQGCEVLYPKAMNAVWARAFQFATLFNAN